MKYVGSKKRIAPEIAEQINSIAMLEGIQNYYEPFMGGCSVGEVVTIQNRYLSDINKYLVALMEKAKAGLDDYRYISREEWYKIKEQLKEPGKHGYPDWLVGWALYGCGWRGNPTAYGGIYTDKATGKEVNPQEQAYNSLKAESVLLKDITFINARYNEIDIKDNSVIYCDAPYRNTYYDTYGYTEKLDFEAYDEWLIEKSKNNLVLISEYQMFGKHTLDFIELKSWEFNKSIGAGHSETENSVEKLFYVKNGWLTKKYFEKQSDFDF